MNFLRLAKSISIFHNINRFSTTAMPWTPESRRTGAIGLKIGMIPIWDKWGKRIPCTVVQIDNCQVIQIKTKKDHGYSALQLGTGAIKIKNVPRAQLGHFEKVGVEPKRKLFEFRITEDAILPIGTTISCLHFVPGQMVDIGGITKGKGFQGVMKRYGFHGMPATHGTTLKHRHGGSIGQRENASRVFPGKKMPGRMGGHHAVSEALEVVKLEPIRNLIYVKGSIPGNKGEYVTIIDSYKNKFKIPPPFPTWSKTELPKENDLIAPVSSQDPYKWYYDS